MVRRFHDNLSRSKKNTEDLEQAYQSGYSEGDGAGYTRGYSEGESAGDTAGYSRGYSEGEAAGISATKKGSAIAENVLTGKTFTNTSGIEIPGTMPDKTGFSQIITPGTSQQEILIPKGFHDGAGKITVSAGLDTSDATATAGNILTGATAYVNNVKVTGTMPNQASWSQTVTPGSAAQSIAIPAGYHNGSGKVNVGAASSNIVKVFDDDRTPEAYGGQGDGIVDIEDNFLNDTDYVVFITPYASNAPRFLADSISINFPASTPYYTSGYYIHPIKNTTGIQTGSNKCMGCVAFRVPTYTITKLAIQLSTSGYSADLIGYVCRIQIYKYENASITQIAKAAGMVGQELVG